MVVGYGRISEINDPVHRFLYPPSVFFRLKEWAGRPALSCPLMIELIQILQTNERRKKNTMESAIIEIF